MTRRSIAYVWGGVALFIVVLYVVLHTVVVRSFVELESQNTSRNVERVLDAMAEQETSISAKASDWSAWDDAYEFMQDGNARFIRSNFALSAFTGINLNLIAYVHNSGEIAYARWYYPGSDRMAPLPAEVRQVIDLGSPLTTHRDVHSSVRGIVMLKQGPMLVASRPVVTSNEEGPVRGSLIFGQLFGPEQVTKRLTYHSRSRSHQAT